MFTYDHFILIESDPRIEQRVAEHVNTGVDELQRFLESKFSQED
jgi:hypothetical protein